MRCSERSSFGSSFPQRGASAKPEPRDRPGVGHGHPTGHSCVAVSGPVEQAKTIETGHGDRQANMLAFAQAALELLAVNLEKGR